MTYPRPDSPGPGAFFPTGRPGGLKNGETTMSLHDAETITLGAKANPLGGGHDPAIWSTFTRLVQHLDTYAKVPDQIRQTLETVQEAAGADVVCCHNEATGDLLPTAEVDGLSGEAFRSFTHKLLTRQAAGTTA